MFKNYFRIAYRNLQRRKSYAFITISGLAIGMAACLLIFQVVRYETSYNTYQPAYKNIYHVLTQDKTKEGISYNPGISYPALEALRTDLPGITTGALYSTYGTQVNIPLSGGRPGKKFIEDYGLFFADPAFCSIFSFGWLVGNARVLGEPNTVVLTRKIAEKYFGDWHKAMGQIIRVDNMLDLKVSGIIENTPANSDFPIALLGSFITIKNNRSYGYTDDWGSVTSNFQIFSLLPGKSVDQIRSQLPALSNKYYKNKGVNKRMAVLQPLSDIHFNKEIGSFGTHTTSRSTLITLSMIAFFIILMACINFINLSTAQAITRSKEVGVRKVLGGGRWQLFLQTLSETGIVVVVAALCALAIAWLALPYIKHVTLIEEELSLFTRVNFIFILGVIAVTTLLSGFYPGVVLSRFRPALALKSRISSATVGGISLRRSLVVLQFVISQVLIVGTLIAVSQMDYIRMADLGFNKEALLILPSSSSASMGRHPAFKQSLLQLRDVKLVSLGSDVPSSDNNSSTNFSFDHRPDESFDVYTKFGDADYFKTFDLRFVAGKPYETNDSSGVVVNQTLVKKLNLSDPQEALGKDIRLGSGRWRKIRGVVADFKTNSLREAVKPLLIGPFKRQFDMVSIKLQGKNLASAQVAVQKLWDRFFPEYAYSSHFMDERIDLFYQQEKQMALLYKLFAALAIFISGLGLYGLVSFMVVQKTREVGVRKVLGASVANIVLLFSREFTWLIALALIISTPIAWYFMNGWLDNFAYRIHIGWVVFFIGALASLAVAWLSVGYKAMRAAIANPVKSLRNE